MVANEAAVATLRSSELILLSFFRFVLAEAAEIAEKEHLRLQRFLRETHSSNHFVLAETAEIAEKKERLRLLRETANASKTNLPILAIPM